MTEYMCGSPRKAEKGRGQRGRSALCAVLSGVFFLFALLWSAACLSEDEFSLSTSDRLAFSRDTVQLDTIISGRPTKTETLTIYNKASRALRIRSVSLTKGAASPFAANVDGQSLDGGMAEDFEIAAKDSLIVFLMCNAPETDSDEPVEVADELVFVLESGVRQAVPLRASSQDVVRLDHVVLRSDTTLDAPRPYLVTDSLVVASGVRLTVAPGVRLYFQAGAALIVRGTLDICGTTERPVVLRGDRLENMFSGQPYDRIPGQWGGVIIAAESFDNRIDNCDLHSSIFGVRVDSASMEREKLRIENSILHNTSRDALSVRHAKVFVGNTQITNAGGNCITLRGGDTAFIHCTVARFYYFTGGSGVALDFANFDGRAEQLPLKTRFANCIVTGFQKNEVMGSRASDESVPFDYVFENCLLNTPETDDEHIVRCLWDEGDTAREKNFTPDFDLSRLIFSFDLRADSPAAGAADAAITNQYYPFDRLGRSRFAEGAPDMGCYQHVTGSE